VNTDEKILEMARDAMADAGMPASLETLDAARVAYARVRDGRARAYEHAQLRQAEADAARLAESRLSVAQMRLRQLIASQSDSYPDLRLRIADGELLEVDDA
jgi:hypothetical protein